MTKIYPMHYIGERDGKTKHRKRRQNILLVYLCSYTQHTWPPSRFIQDLKKLSQMGAGKYMAELFVREKENWTKKGLVSNMWLPILYTVQLISTKLCTKFQDPK